jgi:nucleoside diphosphate kinase
MEEKSVFMLKPESMSHKEEIMSMIEKSGILIKEWRHLKLEEHQLRSMYPDAVGEIWHKTKEKLLDKEVLAAIVEGDDVVEKLYKVCGENTKPFLCEPGSIRNLFKDITSQDGVLHQNIIHRPKNQKEAEEHLVLFFPPDRK